MRKSFNFFDGKKFSNYAAQLEKVCALQKLIKVQFRSDMNFKVFFSLFGKLIKVFESEKLASVRSSYVGKGNENL